MDLAMILFTMFYSLMLVYFITSFFVSVPPFRRRLDAAMVGIPAIAVGAFILYPFVLDNYARHPDQLGSRANAATYNPQSVSEATGQTIRQLNEQQLVVVGIAAKFMTMMNYCNYNFRPGRNPIVEHVEQYGVNVFDFKLHTRRFSGPTLAELRNGGDWQYFCGTEIYDVFGLDGELFGPGGIYPNIDPWIRRIEIRDGMTRVQVEAEIEMNVAEDGAARCNLQFDQRKAEARRGAMGIDAEWRDAANGQTAPILNEASFRLGSDDLMNCSRFRSQYGEYLLR